MAKCYSVKDKKANKFLSFIWVDNIVELQRQLSTVVNDPKHPFCNFAEDFALYQVCEGNFDSGIITLPVNGPVPEFELITLKKGAQKNVQ